SSTTSCASLQIAVRHGLRLGTILTTTWSLSTNTTSIAKRMKNVCTDHSGRSTSPSPGSRLLRPSSPRERRRNVSARVQLSQITRPSSSRRRTTSPGPRLTSVVEDLVDLVGGGAEDDQEHRREDQEDEREQHLDRRLLRALLGGCAPALAHLDRKVPHDLADRHAQRLALENRPDERAKARGVG